MDFKTLNLSGTVRIQVPFAPSITSIRVEGGGQGAAAPQAGQTSVSLGQIL